MIMSPRLDPAVVFLADAIRVEGDLPPQTVTFDVVEVFKGVALRRLALTFGRSVAASP